MASNPSLSSPHLLSTSISSLSSSVSSSRNPSSSSSISKAYRQASTLFLTRRLPEALSTVLPLITPPTSDDDDPNANNNNNGPSSSSSSSFEPAPVARASRTTRIKVWSLYLTILNAILELDSDEGKDAFGTQEWRALCVKVRDGEVWEEVVRNGYHGVEGDVDADVVINLATLLLAHAKTQILNQKRLENYLAAARTPNLDTISPNHFSSTPKSKQPRLRSPAKPTNNNNNNNNGTDTPRDLAARVKILELYTLHVLLRNNEWEYARDFISVSPVLDDERREAFLQALASLQEEQAEAEQREQTERKRREDEVMREVEEARRQRRENEEREGKRVEEERVRRERKVGVDEGGQGGSEVDYGVEERTSLAGSGSGSAKRPGSLQSNGSVARGLSGTKKGGKVVASSGSGGAAAAAPPSLGARASMMMTNLRALVEQMGLSFQTNPYLLFRTVAFIIALLLMFGRKSVRERISRIMGAGWDKVRATAGMGVKVSYI
ncbi:hypothetical protein B0T17DRAFT_637246 [Bombardia bombarda]|uniref:Peroxin 26 n=1 Tax=Bombardia bombarda TaxID=252184 RepID=A0AA39XBB2_9PEZI|nr:hypothetical protein B0T17DRAFT_637246 [Bombardia bombarda]